MMTRASRVVRCHQLERLAAGTGARSMWPRSDDRHLAAQHIEELWQFIERRLPQERSDTGNPRVVPRTLHQPAAFRCTVMHRAELPHLETDIVEADAALSEQHRAGG